MQSARCGREHRTDYHHGARPRNEARTRVKNRTKGRRARSKPAFKYAPARAVALQRQRQLIGFIRCCVLGGHRRHYIVAMGEQELAAFMGAEFMMGTATGDWRLQHVQ